jgi:UDP-N-acetylmuramate dehydrogenase
MFKLAENVPLSPRSLFGIGGNARYFAEVRSAAEAVRLVEFARQKSLPVFILGGGSNILISDAGFDGLVISTIKMRGMEVCGDSIAAEAGISMGQIARFAAERSLSGAEWMVGIPGTLGGSVRGNAGCYDGEMKKVLTSVSVLNVKTGEESELSLKDCKFGYRDSVFKRCPELVILAVKIQLYVGDQIKIRELIKKYSVSRVATQDIGAKCAGCFFKNILWNKLSKDKALQSFPEFAEFVNKEAIPTGFIVDRLQLKGYAIGGAQVSNKHGNYIINNGMATATDIRQVANFVREKVFKHYGIILEEEVQLIGF